ncbi:putative gonadotropin, beta subunit protein [Helianthus debilis subsp. tardiflorus]
MTSRRQGGVLLRWANSDCSGFCPTSLILLKFFEDSDRMDFACLRLLCLRMQCALMMVIFKISDFSLACIRYYVILKISDLSLAIYIYRCFSYGGCSIAIVATSYPSLHTI